MATLANWIEYADNQALMALSADISALVSALKTQVNAFEFIELVNIDG